MKVRPYDVSTVHRFNLFCQEQIFSSIPSLLSFLWSKARVCDDPKILKITAFSVDKNGVETIIFKIFIDRL